MRDKRKAFKLYILGAYPPPRGGVTTHIERLLPRLEITGIPFVLWDHSRVRKAARNIIPVRSRPLQAVASLASRGTRVLYWPVTIISPGKLICLLLFRALGFKPVLMLVASADQATDRKPARRAILKLMCRLATRVVAANPDFGQFLEAELKVPRDRLAVLPAFIPQGAADRDKRPLPDEAVAFCQEKTPVFLTYAVGPDRHNHEDLYGLDLFVELAVNGRRKWPEAGYVIVLPQVTDAGYVTELKARVETAGLTRNIYWAIGNQVSFVSFLDYADLFIRATNTDGDALTVREALYGGVPVVASDVCRRPTGTSLFRDRDKADLAAKSDAVLTTAAENEFRPPLENNASKFIKLFEQAAND